MTSRNPWKCLAALLLLTALAACTDHLGTPPLPQTGFRAQPVIQPDDSPERAATTLSVLIYNVAGLPWPIRSGRGPALEIIGAQLAGERAAGTAPDLVLLQEAFTPQAGNIGMVAGYHNRVRGPVASDGSYVAVPQLDAVFLDGRSFWKGERLGKLTSSGLYIYADYPIRTAYQSAFGPNTCAGFDCLANKGVMMVVLDIPGVPVPVQILNTHLNARRASGVGPARTLYAHQRQIDEIRIFLDRYYNPDWPLIYGGDFNTRRSLPRYGHKEEQMPGTVVDYYCSMVQADCDMRMTWDGDAPWLATQDLQGFADGRMMRVRPVRVEARFDAPVSGGSLDGAMLSDHDGYLVTYELSWPMAVPLP